MLVAEFALDLCRYTVFTRSVEGGRKKEHSKRTQLSRKEATKHLERSEMAEPGRGVNRGDKFIARPARVNGIKREVRTMAMYRRRARSFRKFRDNVISRHHPIMYARVRGNRVRLRRAAFTTQTARRNRACC